MRKIPCKIPCWQGIQVETGAISTASPARQSDAQRICPQECQKCPPMAGFCELAAGLQTPYLASSGAKYPIVSGQYLKYSRFQETRGRRPGSIRTAWSSSQWNVVKFCALAAGSWEFRTYC